MLCANTNTGTMAPVVKACTTVLVAASNSAFRRGFPLSKQAARSASCRQEFPRWETPAEMERILR
jgi:hypothetical protein